MAEKLITVLILSTIFVRGKMYKEGDEVQVNEREAKELINRGVATDETDVTVEEDTTVAIEDMEQEELYKYAKPILGNKISKKSSKEEIIAALNEADDEDGEE